MLGDGMTPTSLGDRDDILDGWKLLPLGGCSRPESWGCVCWGWAHSLWPGVLRAAGQAGHSGWGRWRTEASRAWDRRTCPALSGSHRPPTSLRAPKAAPRPERQLPRQSRLSVEVEHPSRGLSRHKACCVMSVVAVAVLCPSAEPPEGPSTSPCLLDLHGQLGLQALLLGTPVPVGHGGGDDSSPITAITNHQKGIALKQ